MLVGLLVGLCLVGIIQEIWIECWWKPNQLFLANAENSWLGSLLHLNWDADTNLHACGGIGWRKDAVRRVCIETGKPHRPWQRPELSEWFLLVISALSFSFTFAIEFARWAVRFVSRSSTYGGTRRQNNAYDGCHINYMYIHTRRVRLNLIVVIIIIYYTEEA